MTSIISKERGYMRPKITFLLYLFLLFGAVHIGKKWVELNKIYNADESLKSEYAITNSLEQDWLDIGAVNVVTYEESGMRYIYFDEYTVSYQAFDEKDDILGTIIARRTGNETIKVEVKLMQDLYISSRKFSKNTFSYYSQKKLYDDIYYSNGEIQNEKIYPEVLERDLQIACEHLLNSIESFKTISTIVFEKCYLQKKAMIWKDTITYLIILGTILVYSVMKRWGLHVSCDLFHAA